MPEQSRYTVTRYVPGAPGAWVDAGAFLAVSDDDASQYAKEAWPGERVIVARDLMAALEASLNREET